MTEPQEVEHTFGSTTWTWRKVKISRGAAGNPTARRSRSSFLRLAPWDRSREVTLRVLYRGGSEAWYLVKARGEHQVFPGHASLEDVMARVYSER